MSMTQCKEGHFYDRAQNTSCPFCGVGTAGLTMGIQPSDGPTVQHADEGKTQMARPGPSLKKPDVPEEGATIALWAINGGMDPIVGWLVCTEGKSQGRDYRIRAGFNNIGRHTSSHICIASDESIAREEHAKIFYDHENATFNVLAASGRSGIYLNGKAVLQPTELHAYDLLKIGATKLLFVPFCGEKFRWDLGT